MREEITERERKIWRWCFIYKKYYDQLTVFDLAKLVLFLPFVFTFMGISDVAKEIPKVLYSVYCVFLLWLFTYHDIGVGFYVLAIPIMFVILLSGGITYPFRVWFDADNLVEEHCADAVGTMFNHDGNSNTGMATGISMGLSED